jgi:site-specific DNA-adenine methylase
MWSYYGAKTNVVNWYPKPKFDKIIEPFAGSARYALKYFDREILLVDKYETIIKIWQWLQKCSPDDIRKLPRMKQGEHVDNFIWDCQEAKDLMGFVIGFITESPRKTGTIRLTQRPNHVNYTLNRIANNLYKIKHWEIKCDTYENIPNQNATWFVDPPYQFGGHCYKESSKNIDFESLKNWCISRTGQIIVCESSKATWMDFKLIGSHKTRTGFQKEAIWSNFKTDYDAIQQSLLF